MSELLKIIQEEKDAFVCAEYGRLQAIMGAEYTENGERKIFHPLPDSQKEAQTLPDPNELNLTELAMLPDLERAIPRFGTLSFMPLFRTSPYEAERLKFLADIQEKLLIGLDCSKDEEKILRKGHQDFVRFKHENDDVVVIKGDV